jgi:hypothetical protein
LSRRYELDADLIGGQDTRCVTGTFPSGGGAVDSSPAILAPQRRVFFGESAGGGGAPGGVVALQLGEPGAPAPLNATRVVWRTAAAGGGSVSAGLALRSDGAVYFCSESPGTLHLAAARDGALLYSFPLDSRVFSGVAVAATGAVHVATAAGKLVALSDAADRLVLSPRSARLPSRAETVVTVAGFALGAETVAAECVVAGGRVVVGAVGWWRGVGIFFFFARLGRRLDCAFGTAFGLRARDCDWHSHLGVGTLIFVFAFVFFTPAVDKTSRTSLRLSSHLSPFPPLPLTNFWARASPPAAGRDLPVAAAGAPRHRGAICRHPPAIAAAGMGTGPQCRRVCVCRPAAGAAAGTRGQRVAWLCD